MLTIGERMVNEPLNNTSINLSFKGYDFKCSIDKAYGDNQTINYLFEFSDGSLLLYNKTNDYINKIKDYGQASNFTLSDAHTIFEKNLNRMMIQASNKYIAKGRYANYDNYSK